MVKEVAQALGNTPSVCRKSYIDPAVFEAWKSGRGRTNACRALRCRRARWNRAALTLLKAQYRPAKRASHR